MARDNTRATHADSPHIHRRPRRRAPSPIPRHQRPRTKTPSSDHLPYIHFTTRAHRPPLPQHDSPDEHVQLEMG